MLELLLLSITSGWTLLGLIALLRVTGRAPAPAEVRAERPPISVLKPLCGADEELEENLRSFFAQVYPGFELIFGVEDPSDPAVAVVRRLMAAHPHVPATLVLGSATRATNPKVSNLGGMLPHARYELILISDSNIRAPADYLEDLAASLGPESERVGMVSNLFSGTGEQGLGAALENVQINGFVASGIVTPALFRNPVVVGKSMLMRRSVLARLGGLESVADVLAEDYLIGKMFQHAGWKIRLAPRVLQNVTRRAPLEAFWRRHLRWSMLRIRLHPVAFVLEPLASPLALLPLALSALGGWGLLWALSMVMVRDVAGWWRLRGTRRLWIPLLLAPLREVLVLAIWAATPFSKHVAWRGHAVRVGAGTRVFIRDPDE